jgi:hypothetical protein
MARNLPLTPSEPDLEIQIEGGFEYRALVIGGLRRPKSARADFVR